MGGGRPASRPYGRGSWRSSVAMTVTAKGCTSGGTHGSGKIWRAFTHSRVCREWDGRGWRGVTLEKGGTGRTVPYFGISQRLRRGWWERGQRVKCGGGGRADGTGQHRSYIDFRD